MISQKDRINFVNKVSVSQDGCWVWLASHFKNGYGQFKIARRPFYAHRVSYEIYKGEIPPGMYIMHTCDDPGCVNPEHLVLGTPSENVKDMLHKNRGKGKLTLQEVQEVYDLVHSGALTPAEISTSYGISRTTISQIKGGRHYRK